MGAHLFMQVHLFGKIRYKQTPPACVSDQVIYTCGRQLVTNTLSWLFSPVGGSNGPIVHVVISQQPRLETKGQNRRDLASERLPGKLPPHIPPSQADYFIIPAL